MTAETFCWVLLIDFWAVENQMYTLTSIIEFNQIKIREKLDNFSILSDEIWNSLTRLTKEKKAQFNFNP